MNFDFADEEYIKWQNAQIFTYIMYILKGRCQIYGNSKVEGLINSYLKEKDAFSSDYKKITFGNGPSVANCFINKVLKENNFEFNNPQRSEEETFYEINHLLDKNIEETINLIPRDKLLFNLVMFANMLSTLSYGKSTVSPNPKSDVEKLIKVLQEIDNTGSDLANVAIGEIKESINYLINKLIMMPEQDCELKEKAESYFLKYRTDYNLFFCYGISKVLLLLEYNTRYLIKRRFNSSQIKFSKDRWLSIIPKKLEHEFSKYLFEIDKGKENLGIDQTMSESIFSKFKNEYHFDPIELESIFPNDFQKYTLAEQTASYICKQDLINNLNDKGISKAEHLISFLKNNILNYRKEVYDFVNDFENNNLDVTLFEGRNTSDLNKKLNENVFNKIKVSQEVKEMFAKFVGRHLKISKGIPFSFSISDFPAFVADYLSYNKLPFFHHPIIEIDDYYLTSYAAINEGVHHIRGDVLKRRTFGGEEISKEITKFFDEKKINLISHYLSLNYSDYEVNCDLMASKPDNEPKYPKIKYVLENNDIFKNGKHLKKELDVIFVSDNTLYIYDLKNYGFQRSLDEVERLVNRVNKEHSKLKKFKKLVEDNKSIFEEEFEMKFEVVRVGILTANTSIFEFMPNLFKDFYINSADNFVNKRLSYYKKNYKPSERQRQNRIKKLKQKHKKR